MQGLIGLPQEQDSAGRNLGQRWTLGSQGSQLLCIRRSICPSRSSALRLIAQVGQRTGPVSCCSRTLLLTSALVTGENKVQASSASWPERSYDTGRWVGLREGLCLAGDPPKQARTRLWTALLPSSFPPGLAISAGPGRLPGGGIQRPQTAAQAQRDYRKALSAWPVCQALALLPSPPLPSGAAAGDGGVVRVGGSIAPPTSAACCPPRAPRPGSARPHSAASSSARWSC